VAEEETKRRSFDAFLGDIRVEERHYMRENKSLFTNTKSMVLQERLYFRNLPLSNWIEHELTVEQGHTADLANLARAASVFSSQAAGALAGAEAAGALPVPQRAEPPAPRHASPADSGAPFGSPAANGAFGTGGNRRAFGAPRGATGISKVAPIVEEHYGDHQDAPAGQVAFSNRFSGSRLIRG
jgi:hypothetical protein